MSSTEPYLIFLGTAGSRWVVSRQMRATGGLFLHAHGVRMHIDPGPGALVRCAMSDPPIDPTLNDAVLLTHGHIDHSNDVNIMLDARTAGGFNKGGVLYAPRECLEGDSPVVFNYLKPHLDEIVVLEESTSYRLGDLEFKTSVSHRHRIETYGIKFNIHGKTLAFLVDTSFFPELGEAYADADTLIVSVTFCDPAPHPKILHLCVEDAVRIARDAQPERMILTHFGMTMLERGPDDVAKEIADKTGIETLAAFDGMRLDL